MAFHSKLFQGKLPIIGLKALIAFGGLVLIICTYATFRPVKILTSGHSEIKLSRAPLNLSFLNTSSKKKFDYLSSYASNCQPNELSKVWASRRLDGSYSVRLVKTSKTTTCPRELHPATYTFPRTWLLSQPGSGNTWVRHLLQQMTGIPTGAVYSDGNLRKHGFPYENRTDHVVAIKTHNFWSIEKKKQLKIRPSTDRMILLIRNPYSSFLAEYKRGRMKLKHTGNGIVNVNNQTWQEFIHIQLPRWHRVIRRGLRSKLDKIIIFYDDLGSQLLRQLVRLANFLRNDTLEEFAFCCALHEGEGNHHRPSSSQTEEQVYSMDNKKLINDMLSELAKSVREDNPKIAARLVSYIKSL